MEHSRIKKGNLEPFKRFFKAILPTILISSVLLFPSQSEAYTDYSVWKIETGGLIGEESVKTSLDRLKAETNWWATYEPTGAVSPYYQLYSGSYYGEENVKNVLNQFQTTTGFKAAYQPVGNPVPYKQIISGSYYGEENVKQILQSFQESTGISGTYVPTGNGIPKKRVLSGGYVGEDSVKEVLRQFQEATGITASYESNGQYSDYYHLISGGYYGEENVKSILADFTAQTGINASYVPSYYADTYSVISGGFVGETTVQAIVNQINNDLGLTAKYVGTSNPDVFNIVFDSLYGDSLSKVTAYLDNKHWWYSKTATGNKVPLNYNIVSEPSLDKSKLDAALKFFQSRNWWASVNPTGQKLYNVFQIVTSPTVDDSMINNALAFFSNRGLWATSELSKELAYPYFNIVSEPLLENEKVTNALSFFQKRGWWAAPQETGKYGYTVFGITSEPILGLDNSNSALNFFKENGWYAVSTSTGKTEGVFKIVTGGFQGYETALANVKLLADHYGWWSTPVKVQNGPQVTYTNYNLSLYEMLNLQMNQSPQTDKYRNDPAYIHSSYVDLANNKITVDGLNVRSGPGTSYASVAKLNAGFTGFKVLETVGDWYRISLTWRNAKPEDVEYYLNPNNFPSDSNQYFQYLKLSKPAGINVSEVNEKILNSNAGILQSTAGIFAQAAQLYNINELYLISHALLETGNGQSALAKGINYNGKVVYNMYGYGAYDSCPETCGAQTAYEKGWFTPELAIIGGAELIGKGYIYNDTFQQDTIYKMRWNPVLPYHQYATDIAWASKQVNNIYNLYKLLDNYTLYVDIPVYK
ncbi:N-acetylglucosaminidase [Neobacillus citreus]|uniref:N-acetylglucosaminidase n=1 Tax=Neobacillus citreus TaxID=2833578 RepID=A0A942T2C4_9BACI|nr:N-acetylglucosaminidase [Neobacillus citreus]MCH6266532.1 N-acetylglucosaminidase [Neobacillus citreus]